MGLATGMILSMSRAMAEWAESSRAGITVQPQACLHRLNKRADCRNCVDVCPVDALSLAARDDRQEIVLDRDACVKCGLCTPVCPVGAIEGDQGAAEVVTCVAQAEKRTIVELACALHPAPAQGPPQSNLVVRTRGCLGALGASTLSSLLSLGVYHLLLRVDACEACPLGAHARPQIALGAAQVASLFTAESDLAAPVTLLEAVRDDWPARPVIAARAPGKTRRGFFRSLATAQDVPAQARALSPAEDPPQAQQPPAERRRLLKALAQLPAEQFALEPLTLFPTTLLAAGETCNACGLCARACPTGAIAFVVDENDYFELSMRAEACTDCGVCLDLCEQEALQRCGTPTLGVWTAVAPQVLRAGTLRHCARCGVPFSGPPEVTLCGPCDFRRQYPFGSRTPRWFKRSAAPQPPDDNQSAQEGLAAADE